MRSRILWQVGQWKEVIDKLTLLTEVWPLQLAARSATVNLRLCAIAFNDEPNFPALVDAILPLVSPHEGGGQILPLAKDKEAEIFDRHPGHVLALLSVVLPDDATKWPYGMDAALGRLQKAASSIAKDARLIELKGRLARSRL